MHTVLVCFLLLRWKPTWGSKDFFPFHLLFLPEKLGLELKAGIQGRNWRRRHRGTLFVMRLPLVYSATFLRKPGPPAQEWRLPQWVEPFYLNQQSRKHFTTLPIIRSDRQFLSWDSFFMGMSSFVSSSQKLIMSHGYKERAAGLVPSRLWLEKHCLVEL